MGRKKRKDVIGEVLSPEEEGNAGSLQAKVFKVTGSYLLVNAHLEDVSDMKVEPVDQ